MKFAWRPRSVRMRLTLWYGGALTLALLGYAIFVYVLLWRMLSADLDRQLDQDVKLAEQVLDVENGHLKWDEDARDEDRNLPRIEVYGPEGRLLYHSPSYKGVTPAAFRILTRPGRIEGMPPLTIRAARPLKPMIHELRFLALVLILGIPLAAALAAGGGYALARRALSPVDRMAGQAQIITADQLCERLAVENPADELGRLATIFNDMIARLERSFDQLRRFTADASHELRTPLTVIRSVGEVALEQRHGEARYRETIGSMLEEVGRLGRLVDSLLTLSRADGGQVRLHREPADLAALAGEVVQQLKVLAEEKGQTLELDAPAAVPAPVDRVVLSQALSNLVDNAIKYAPPQTGIRIAVRRRGERAELEVSDHGPGIAPEHCARIFDRFYRVDKARARELGGVGLGLAIARWGVEAHGGAIELESEAGRGSTFRISLPEEKGRG